MGHCDQESPRHPPGAFFSIHQIQIFLKMFLAQVEKAWRQAKVRR